MNYISKTSNKALMSQARESLRGMWGLAIGTILVYSLICVAVGYVTGGILSLLIAGPMVVGANIFCLALSRKQNPQFSQIFNGFTKFGVALGAYLLQLIFVFLWTLLLIIPGIIAAFSYAMTFYIIAENDSIGPLEAIRKSKEMMQGNKWKLFCLGWRFIGWFLLCLLTLGIGFLWLYPYMAISYAKFYDDLANKEAIGPEGNKNNKANPISAQTTTGKDEGKKFCTRCGKENAGTSKFCFSCGNQLTI